MHKLLVVVLLASCARIYTLRASVGVERASDGDRSVQGTLAFGFAGNVRGRHYVAPSGRVGMAVHEDPEAVLGAGAEYMLVLDHATVRAGPDYLHRTSIEGNSVYHALGGRFAALYTFSSERAPEQNGLLDMLVGASDPMPALMGVGSNATAGNTEPKGNTLRRHSIGLEGSAGFVVSGDDRSVVYLGIVYEHDVLRRKENAPER